MEQSSPLAYSHEELLAQEAIGRFAATYQARRSGEELDTGAYERSRIVAVIACGALIPQESERYPWYAPLRDRLEERDIEIRWSPKQRRQLQRTAFSSVALPQQYFPDDIELVIGLLAEDPRIRLTL